MAELLGPTPDEINILLEIARPIGTSFEVIEDFKGKCFEHRRAAASQEDPRSKFERLPERAKMFFTESVNNLTFENATEFASKITQILVMWAEVRELEGKKRQVIEHHERRDNLS